MEPHREDDGGPGPGRSANSSLIAIGSARLPKSAGGEQPNPLLIELVLDPTTGCVADVAATVPLPGYTALLRSLLVGRRLDEVECAAQALFGQIRGPLLRPTIAALADAARHADPA